MSYGAQSFLFPHHLTDRMPLRLFSLSAGYSSQRCRGAIFFDAEYSPLSLLVVRRRESLVIARTRLSPSQGESLPKQEFILFVSSIREKNLLTGLSPCSELVCVLWKFLLSETRLK
jgi:hypothetical protein